MAETTYRISKVASELNVSFTTLVDKLSDKGFSVESKPTTKITEEMYQLLLSEFKSDKAAKDESKSLKISIPKTLKGTSGQDKLIKSAEKTTPPTLPPSDPDEEENDQIFVKDNLLKTPQASEDVTEKPPSEEKPSTTNEENNDQKVIRPDVIKPRILGKIDLDNLGKGKKSPKITEEKTISEKELEVSEKVDIKPLDSTDVLTNPENTTHLSPPQQEENLATVEKESDASPNETPVSSDTTEHVEVTDTTDKDRSSAINEVPESEKTSPSENIIEQLPEKGVETIVTQFETLRGLKIKGKIELKTEDPSSNAKNKILKEYAQEKKKKKRTRKVVEKVKIEEAIKDKKPAPQGQKPVRTDRNHKGPITDKEVQDRLKKTLSRIDSSGRGKTNKSKMKRMRREMNETDRMREQALHEMEDRVLKVTEFLSASELASLMDVSVNDIITTCFNLGLMVSINQRLDAETITIVADEFGFDVNFVDADAQVNIKDEEDDPNDLEHRAPIVTVMGHVDHGKTSLLDHIRSANVIAGEAGGITQHIGAYEVILDDGQKITFLDTPGHEAFTAMRARGAKVTDIAVIVIAADDSVMPQTREAISHAQAANVPMIFAINKIDKPGANPEKIKEELSQMNILVEDWGGKFQCQEIAAKLGKNIDKLLEKILLEAELLELKANPNRKAKGTVIEAKLDKGRGIIASMLVQTGTLSVGDHVVAGAFYGKVKALFNERSSRIDVAGPSTPIGMLGFSGAPTAGDPFLVFETEAEAKELAAKRYQLLREQGIRSTKHITLDEIGRRLAVGNFKELNLIVKGDVDGSVEALSDSLLKLSTEEIQIKVIHKGVGQITESDVLLASASDAIIIGFQVRPAASAKKIAEAEQIDIRTYSIIYKAIDEVKSAVEGMLSPELVEKITGNAEVRETFSISKVGTIAGCMVLDGKASRGSQLRIVRDGVVIHTGKLLSLKRFKDDVKEVLKGYECGLQVEKFNDLHVGDILEFFTEDEVKRKLK